MAFQIPSLANTGLTDMYKKLSNIKKPPQNKYNFYQTPQQNAQNIKTSQPNISSLYGIPKLPTPTKTTTAGVETPLRTEITSTPVGPNTNVVKGTTTQNYYSPYQQQIDNKLNQIMNVKPYQFDQNNIALQQAQKQAMEQSRKESAKRGRVFDTYAQIKEQESAQKLIPEFYQLGMNQYNQEQQNLYNQLSALRGQETQDYNRFLTDRDYIENQEMQQFGTVLSPMMRDYRQKFQEIPQDILAQLMPLGEQEGGYATTINQLKATDPTNPMLPYLEIMRANKVISDPLLMAKYGREYGMETGQIEGMAQSILQGQAQAELEALKSQAELQGKVAEISKIEAEISKIEAEARYKDADTVLKQYDALIKQIEASNLPTELELQAKKLISEISKNYASAETSMASAERTRNLQKLDYEKMVTERLNQELAQGKINQQQYTIELEREKLIEQQLENLKLENSETIDPNVVSSAYLDYVNSGLDIKEWLVQPRYAIDPDTNEYLIDETTGKRIPLTINGSVQLMGSSLTTSELQDLLDVVAERDPAQKDAIAEAVAKLITEEIK